LADDPPQPGVLVLPTRRKPQGLTVVGEGWCRAARRGRLRAQQGQF
jgi:hypothetical protein